MPKLNNMRHEMFARAIASGKSEVDACSAGKYAKNRTSARRLQSDPSVSARIAELKAEAVEANKSTLESVLLAIERIAFFDIRKVLTWSKGGVALKKDALLDDATCAAIREVSVARVGSYTIKTYSKVTALQKLYEYHMALKSTEDEARLSRNHDHLAGGALSRYDRGYEGAPVNPERRQLTLEDYKNMLPRTNRYNESSEDADDVDQ